VGDVVEDDGWTDVALVVRRGDRVGATTWLGRAVAPWLVEADERPLCRDRLDPGGYAAPLGRYDLSFGIAMYEVRKKLKSETNLTVARCAFIVKNHNTAYCAPLF
jgi:hypothetical protein